MRLWRTLLPLLLVTSLVQSAGAQSHNVQAGAEALSAMQKGSLVGALQQQRVTRSRTRRVTAGLDRDLLRAIRLAAVKPKAALALLARTEKKAQQAGVTLPSETVAQIRAASQAFDHERPLTLSPRDASLRELVKKPEGLTLAQLQEYGRSYAAHMRRYNGNRPNEVLESYTYAGLNGKLKGQVSFWDVDPSRAEVVGLGDASPFRTAGGKVRVYNHYADSDREKALTAEFGPPTGKIEAEMTSSYRTLILFPKKGVPYMLKFSGEWYYGSTKALKPAQVRISVERTLHLRDNPTLVPEPAGLIVSKPGVTVLYRPLPVPRNGKLNPGDTLLSAHVLNDARFAQTALGQRIFARRGSGSDWFKKELAPKLADTIYRSMTSSFAHLELHSQNIDVLVGQDGSVREVFVKDLLDMMHDPALQSASGRRPVGTQVLRDVEWQNIGDPRAEYQVGRFYSTYLGQTTYPGNAPSSHSELHNAIRDEIVEIARTRLPMERLKAYPEYGRVFGDKRPLHETLHDMRELIVKSNLQAGFRKDERARAHLDGGPGIANHSPTRATPQPGVWQYGYIGQVPVAVKQHASGLIEDYFFRFE